MPAQRKSNPRGRPKAKQTQNGLSIKLNVDRKDLRRWMEAENLTLDSPFSKIKACVLSHRRTPKGPQGIDQVTGLPWAQASKREEALMRRIDREEAERKKDKNWVTSEHHLSTLRRLVDRIELAPGRIKSQLGLSEEQRGAVQKVIDDIRTEFVNDRESKPKLYRTDSEEPLQDGSGI